MGNQKSTADEDDHYCVNWDYRYCYLSSGRTLKMSIPSQYALYYLTSITAAPKREKISTLVVVDSASRWQSIKDDLQFCTKLGFLHLEGCDAKTAREALVLLATRFWGRLFTAKFWFPCGITYMELAVLTNHVDGLEWEIVAGESLNNVGVKSCILLQLMRPSWWHGARTGFGGGVGEGMQY
jgi:hypothetical protein